MIEYHGKMYEATIRRDFCVVLYDYIDEEIERLVGEPIDLELDQCRHCGAWRSEDEELYGDGYCAGCTKLCSLCDCYDSCAEMKEVEEDVFICKKCQ